MLQKIPKKWLRPFLFAAGGALTGLALYALVGCANGACVILANPWGAMGCMGLLGLLFSVSPKPRRCCCGGSCSLQPPKP